jgi:hypothetical protein
MKELSGRNMPFSTYHDFDAGYVVKTLKKLIEDIESFNNMLPELETLLKGNLGAPNPDVGNRTVWDIIGNYQDADNIEQNFYNVKRSIQKLEAWIEEGVTDDEFDVLQNEIDSLTSLVEQYCNFVIGYDINSNATGGWPDQAISGSITDLQNNVGKPNPSVGGRTVWDVLGNFNATDQPDNVATALYKLRNSISSISLDITSLNSWRTAAILEMTEHDADIAKLKTDVSSALSTANAVNSKVGNISSVPAGMTVGNILGTWNSTSTVITKFGQTDSAITSERLYSGSIKQSSPGVNIPGDPLPGVGGSLNNVVKDHESRIDGLEAGVGGNNQLVARVETLETEVNTIDDELTAVDNRLKAVEDGGTGQRPPELVGWNAAYPGVTVSGKMKNVDAQMSNQVSKLQQMIRVRDTSTQGVSIMTADNSASVIPTSVTTVAVIHDEDVGTFMYDTVLRRATKVTVSVDIEIVFAPSTKIEAGWKIIFPFKTIDLPEVVNHPVTGSSLISITATLGSYSTVLNNSEQSNMILYTTSNVIGMGGGTLGKAGTYVNAGENSIVKIRLETYSYEMAVA